MYVFVVHDERLDNEADSFLPDNCTPLRSTSGDIPVTRVTEAMFCRPSPMRTDAVDSIMRCLSTCLGPRDESVVDTVCFKFRKSCAPVLISTELVSSSNPNAAAKPGLSAKANTHELKVGCPELERLTKSSKIESATSCS